MRAARARMLPSPHEWQVTLHELASHPIQRELGVHSQRAMLAFDRASVRLEAGALTRVEVRTVLPNGRYAVSVVEIRCAAGEARVFSTQNYAADGTPGRRDDVPVAFGAIPPGTPVAAIRAAVCPA